MNEHGPMPEQRPVDRLLESYVKIGGYVGIGLAVATFLLICLISYKMFFHIATGHMGNIFIDMLLVGATLMAASVVAITVFFCASVFWLPMLIGLIFFASVLKDVAQHVHLHHH